MNARTKYFPLLRKFAPDGMSLLALLSKSVDNTMLREIAGEDYGDDVDLHLKALRDIRETQNIPDPLHWHPREVLELHRWREYVKNLPPDTSRAAHTSRAFACVILVLAAESGIGGENQSIAVLLDSLALLDMAFQKEAIRFFAWSILNLPDIDAQNPFYSLALLILVLRTRFKLTHVELRDLVNLIYDEVRIVREREYAWINHKATPQWLMWLTLFNLRHTLWQGFGQEIAAHADRFPNSAGRQNLKALARHLEDIKVRKA